MTKFHDSVATNLESQVKSLDATMQQFEQAIFGRLGVTFGLAVIEKALSVAKAAEPDTVPFPLFGKEARLWHQAQASAYQHALEMVALPPDLADTVKRFRSENQPEIKVADLAIPQREREASYADHLDRWWKQESALRDSLFGSNGVAAGLDVIDAQLATSSAGAQAAAPFGLDAAEASLWHRAQQSAYQHAAEMLALPEELAAKREFYTGQPEYQAQMLLAGKGQAKPGTFIGKISAVDSVRGLTYQATGRGQTNVYLNKQLSQVPGEGQSAVIRVDAGGLGQVQVSSGQENAVSRGR